MHCTMNLDVISYKLYNWYMYIDTQMLGRAFTVFLGWGGEGGGWSIEGVGDKRWPCVVLFLLDPLLFAFAYILYISE